MTPRDFAANLAHLRDQIVANAMDENSGTALAAKAGELQLSSEQRDGIASLLETALNDALYTVLLGLDGACAINGTQTAFRLFDEDGTELTGSDLESEAWEAFHGDR